MDNKNGLKSYPKNVFGPTVTQPERLYVVKITKIEEIENLTLGHLKAYL
jgi:hypothetical protein